MSDSGKTWLYEGQSILTLATERAYGNARNYILARYGKEAAEEYDRHREAR